MRKNSAISYIDSQIDFYKYSIEEHKRKIDELNIKITEAQIFKIQYLNGDKPDKSMSDDIYIDINEKMSDPFYQEMLKISSKGFFF
jgi:hypothetical protein